MRGFEVQEPILNSPYEEPKAHWRIVEGEPAERVPGRRPALYYYRPPGQAAVEAGIGTAIELKLVNRIRSQVNAWREQGYPGVTRTTLELIQHWLEAAETLIFLTEARPDLRQGIDVPVDEPTAQQKAQGAAAFQRYATKMATRFREFSHLGAPRAGAVWNWHCPPVGMRGGTATAPRWSMKYWRWGSTAWNSATT